MKLHFKLNTIIKMRVPDRFPREPVIISCYDNIDELKPYKKLIGLKEYRKKWKKL